MSKKRKNVKINLPFIFSSALILATFVIVTLFNGTDWTRWLPDFGDIENIKSSFTQTIPETSDVLVHYIDVGQGDAILVQSGVFNALIDGGEYTKDAVVRDYLESVGVKTLDIVFATHPHSDHIGGLDTVIKNFKVKKVYMPEIPEKILPTSKSFEEFLYAIKQSGTEASYLAPDTEITLGDGVFEVFGPLKEYEDLNNMSLVLKFTYKDKSFLFTGDMETDSEYDVLAKGYDVSADVLKVAHHGSSTSSSKKFLNAVDADIYVISVGEGNDYGHPHTEVKKRLSNTGKDVYRTDIDKTVVISTDGKELEVYKGR